MLKYKLEPSLRDIYVEGETDASMIRWFLKEQGNVNAVVYHVSTVDLPKEKVEGWHQENSNRGRVISLALELAAANLLPQATCIVDSDFDIVLNCRQGPKNLVFTDYSCMEMYFFNHWHFEKVFSLVFGKEITDLQAIMGSIASVLQELFLIRLANHLLNLKFGCMTMTACCQIEELEIKFDSSEYLKRYLNKNSGYSQIKSIEQKVEECRRLLRLDCREQMHGHDFLDLLSWYIRKAGLAQRCDDVSISRTLFACLEASKLSTEGLFLTLQHRIQPPATI